MRAAGKKNGVQKQKTRWGTALAAAAAAERLGARKKSFFFWNFFSHLGHHVDLIHGPWLWLTFGLPAAPRATFILARNTKMAISRIGGVLLNPAFYLARPHISTVLLMSRLENGGACLYFIEGKIQDYMNFIHIIRIIQYYTVLYELYPEYVHVHRNILRLD